MNSKSAVLIGVLAAFASTFSGVYLGSRLAISQTREDDRVSFNALFRVMSQNCDHALEQVRSNPPTRKPVALPAPTLLIASVHTNAVTLNTIDEERMAKLVTAVTEVNLAAQNYAVEATRHDQRFGIEPTPISDVPPQFREQAKESRKSYLAGRAESLAGVGVLHQDYQRSIEQTCDIFKEIVQTG